MGPGGLSVMLLMKFYKMCTLFSTVISMYMMQLSDAILIAVTILLQSESICFDATCSGVVFFYFYF